jgi:hypothetical protein
MKKLLSTTALVVALGFPTLTMAQTATTETQQQQGEQQQGQMSGFLAERGQSDLFASDLMGRDVYARRNQAATADTGGQATTGADATHDMAMINRADLDDMDNIGQVNEIVLSRDGHPVEEGQAHGVDHPLEEDLVCRVDQFTRIPGRRSFICA